MRKYFTIFALLAVILVQDYFFLSGLLPSYTNISESQASIYNYEDIFLYSLSPYGRAKPLPDNVRAIHLSYGAYNSTHFESILKQVLDSPINTIVFEIKDPFGRVALHDNSHIARIQGLLPALAQGGIYTIARLVLFHDPFLASSQPDLAIRNSITNSPWQDFRGVFWTDPTQRRVWEYNIDIAHAAQKLGFDEINFDYIRFPTDGPVDLARYAQLDQFESKSDAIGSFLQFARSTLGERAKISIDVFGMAFINDQLDIGQSIRAFVPFVDIISPMPYPSHYPHGFIGFENPAEYPYEIIDYTLKEGAKKLADFPDVIVRPWLQDFNLGGVYDKAKIQAQIKAVHRNNIETWLFWNPVNRYSFSAFTP